LAEPENRRHDAQDVGDSFLQAYQGVIVTPWVCATTSYQKRDARLTHDPRYSDIGPSLTFAIIAAPSRSTRNVKTIKSCDRHGMRLSRFPQQSGSM